MIKIIRKLPLLQRVNFCTKDKDFEDYCSILDEIKDTDFQMKRANFSSEQWDQFQNYSQNMKSYFNNISDKEFLERSKKLLLANKKNIEFNPKQKESISDDYKNYSKYDKAFAQLKQRDFDFSPQQENYQANLTQFINSLDDDLTERRDLRVQVTTARNSYQSMYRRTRGKTVDPTTLSDNELIGDMMNDIDIDFDHNFYNFEDSSERKFIPQDQEMDDPSQHVQDPQEILDLQHGNEGRMSPGAKEDLFQLYNSGWTVRDLSLRYGIIPERVKAIVWLRRTFYDEYLPRMDILDIGMALNEEIEYNDTFPYVDFGIDLAELEDRAVGELQIHWYHDKKKDIFNKNYKQIDLVEKKTFQKESKKKKEINVEAFVGKGNKGYYLKEQINLKGKGSMRVNKKFRHIIEQGNKTYNLPLKVQDKLKLGPREATRGYGIY